MQFIKYDPVCEKGNCIVRALTKVTDKDYYQVKEELTKLSFSLGYEDYREINVFEKYMKFNGMDKLNIKDIKVKDLNLGKGSYCVFCWDKVSYYHMVAIRDNVLYDKDDEGLELFVINVYKKG